MSVCVHVYSICQTKTKYMSLVFYPWRGSKHTVGHEAGTSRREQEGNRSQEVLPDDIISLWYQTRGKKKGNHQQQRQGINREDNERVNIQIKRRGTPLSLPDSVDEVTQDLESCLWTTRFVYVSLFFLLPSPPPLIASLTGICCPFPSPDCHGLSRKLNSFQRQRFFRTQEENKNIFADCLENLLGKLSPSSSRCRI